MDCLRSFSLTIIDQNTYTAASSALTVWSHGNNHSYAIYSTDSSTFLIQGYKNINVFEKKLVFIPVNADLHFSLCVVVNPGLIATNLDSDLDPTEEHAL